MAARQGQCIRRAQRCSALLERPLTGRLPAAYDVAYNVVQRLRKEIGDDH